MAERDGQAAAPARIPLSGKDWQLKGYIGEDWRWRDAHKPGTRDTSGWIPGSVPGTVHHDLWQAGQIPDPYRGTNSLLCEWVPARTWLYTKRFTVDEMYRGSRMLLCFEGIDYEAGFYLNGEALGSHRSMFTPVSFEVGDHLQVGAENLLAVVLEPAPLEQPQVGRSSLVRTHKTRMNYWWDFCPRLVHVGIWDEVYLRATGPVRIERVAVSTQLDNELQEANVDIVVPVSSSREETVVLTTTIRDGEEEIGRQETRHQIPAGGSDLHVSFTLARPALWWPNGYGAQKLYDVSAAVDVETAAGRQRSDERQARFGVRTVELVDNEGAPAGARPYTLAVNGRNIYMKGWNWVPLDVMYGVPRPEKRRRLLSLAQRAHVTMLRVWGGGLIEQEGFYDLCDELGILVWQEFIQSSSGIDNMPPADADFLRFMEEEARQIVPRRRNHPSLAIWGGGNELQDGEGRPLDDSHPLLKLLHSVADAADPGRAWLPTSPTGPCFGNAVENIEADPEGQHDVHGPWIYQGLEKQYALANMGTSLLHSEFGVEGITNLAALEAVIAPEQRRPVRRDNPAWHHLGEWWVWEERWVAYFGDLERLELPAVVRAIQFLQAEGLRYVVEANRRRWPRNSGSFPWQFNEPYPMAACTSAVDYFGQPKPVYHAVARAYAPVSVTARFGRIAWGGDERFEATAWGIGDQGSGIGLTPIS
ncbi:MAG: glycoside hydrolase family 2 TIM barrel-domain containing protein [Anaerolineae bacterium]|nr:glycoside hydrolase family 2 TIM barrel-domain containing protein [Anaerolineae bacterium]